MRCFLAIELPEDVRVRLEQLQDRFRALGRAVRWTRPAHIHLTVKFLGDVADDRLGTVCEKTSSVAGRISSFSLTVAGTGCFPPKGPARVVWAGIAEPPEALIEGQARLERAFAALGFAPEHRPYRPHLTIGRVRDAGASRRIRPAVEAQGDFAGGSFVVNELVLFQSVLEPTGAIHSIVSRARLGEGA